LGYSNVSTRTPSSRAQVSAWRYASGYWSDAAEDFGLNPNREKEAPSFSLFRTLGSAETSGVADTGTNILIVEDNPADVLLIREALEEHAVRANVYVVTDGEKALRFIDAGATSVPCPDLVILDLNLPRRNGREVLAHIRASEEMSKVSVVILSSSDAPRDIEETFRLGVTQYLRKPSTLSEFMQIGGKLRELLGIKPD
jgi:chemotaxis family two-component system response regulator Rcp1